jgi:hypothetical protein
MKAEREHRIPLSARALAIIEEMSELRSESYRFLFPGGRTGKPLSNMAMRETLRRMDCGDITERGPHGEAGRDRPIGLWVGRSATPLVLCGCKVAMTIVSVPFLCRGQMTTV